jgi:hypothetical protein
MNYKNDIKIDYDDLDSEFLKQSVIYNEYADKLCIEEKIKDKAKNNLEIIEAELDLEIRDQAKESGKKLTESIIKSMILLHEKRKNAYDDYIQKKYNYNVIKHALSTLEEKRRSLEKLSDRQIFLYNLPSGYKGKNQLDQARDNISKKIKQNISKKRVKDNG